MTVLAEDFDIVSHDQCGTIVLSGYRNVMTRVIAESFDLDGYETSVIHRELEVVLSGLATAPLASLPLAVRMEIETKSSSKLLEDRLRGIGETINVDAVYPLKQATKEEWCETFTSWVETGLDVPLLTLLEFRTSLSDLFERWQFSCGSNPRRSVHLPADVLLIVNQRLRGRPSVDWR